MSYSDSDDAEISAQYDRLQEFERSEWLVKNFDPNGKLKRENFKISDEQVLQIRNLNSVERNIELIHQAELKISDRKQYLEEISIKFRQMRVEEGRNQRQTSSLLYDEQNQIFEKYKTLAEDVYRKVYNDFVDLGHILKKRLESGANE